MTNFYGHIGTYKAGQLTGDDLRSFEKELAVNKELREAVENHDVVEELLDLLWEDEARRVVEDSQIEITNSSQIGDSSADTLIATEPEAKTRKLKRFIPLAAVLLVLLAVGFMFKDHFSTPLTREELFAKHYSPYMGETVRGVESEDMDIRRCDQGHYYLDEKDIPTAKFLFEYDVNQRAHNCTEKAQWYLSLIYLLEGNDRDMYGLLDRIANDPNHTYRSNAIKLLDDLD